MTISEEDQEETDLDLERDLHTVESGIEMITDTPIEEA